MNMKISALKTAVLKTGPKTQSVDVLENGSNSIHYTSAIYG
jgi:hypothetical protein